MARESWTTEAEAAIRALRDVEGASIQMEGDAVREVHVLTTSDRPAKQIVRDVQTLLLTRFNRPIDHRVVSVAFAEPGSIGANAHPEPTVARTERIRFVSANLYVAGPRVQAQVELQWRGVPRMGSASGWSSREGAHRLVAAATLAAVREYLDDDLALGLHGLEIVRLGGGEAAVVGVELLARRDRRCLFGCCTLDQDPPQAIALATLAALNRVITGLPRRHAVESISRPTSTKGGSEAM
jgi:hypothetical protein